MPLPPLRFRRWVPALLGLAVVTGAQALPTPASALPSAASPTVLPAGQGTDGLERLPPGVRARSMSSLVAAGLVSAGPPIVPGRPAPASPRSGGSTLLWGPAANMSQTLGANEPAAAMHPLDPALLLSGGNGTVINNSSDSGLTWAHRPSPACATYGDGVPAWLPLSVNGGHSALYASLCNRFKTGQFALSRSTDAGVTWAAITSNIADPAYFDDREYLWTDHNPASPFYGRTYLTAALFDSGGSGSFNAVGTKWTTDQGTTWSPFRSVVDSGEFARGENHNEFGALAIEPDGTVVEAWHRGACCGYIHTTNKVMAARSTDGGVTYPYSTTIVTVPLSLTLEFNSYSPGGFRWSDTPNIAADPTDGTLYAVWVQYRLPDAPTSAAVYLSRGSADATTWTTPIIVDDSNRTKFQYMPWVQVSPDHVVHVTYSKAVTNNASLAHFYTQSTDGGETFAAPFQLSNSTYPAVYFMGDYQAASLGGYGAGGGSLLATWTDTSAGEDQWGRVGTFSMGSPTPTVTGTPPTATRTRTPAPSPTAVPTACGGGNYAVSTATTTLVPATDDTGNHCEDCTTTLPLPFPVRLYGVPYTQAAVSSNGQLDFVTPDAAYLNACLPNVNTDATIFPHWDDQNTECAGCGIFTAVSGTAPNRVFTVEWRTVYFGTTTALNYAVALYEAFDGFDLVYGTVPQGGSSATVGVQSAGGARFTQIGCNGGGLSAGLLLRFRYPVCATPSATPTLTRTATLTASATRTVRPTDTPCPLTFSDVPVDAYFYGAVQYLACHGVISGYSDGTFRPYTNTTRAQMVKIVVLGFALTGPPPPTGGTFADVPPGSTFYPYVETAAARAIVSGYTCGAPGEPCDAENRPYFRGGANVTRGQLAKITASAAGWAAGNPATGTFADVLPGSPFYGFVEAAACRGVVSGYTCGGPGEPCDGGNRPYFRQGNNAIRGQIAKIVRGASEQPSCAPALR
ncbi:MAG TPA: S-layer homology domain-containing protein [Chloroflexia bacterium]|nr:S-layer homology domain-containing protein [Chloroflexia bacterium]